MPPTNDPLADLTPTERLALSAALTAAFVEAMDALAAEGAATQTLEPKETATVAA